MTPDPVRPPVFRLLVTESATRNAAAAALVDDAASVREFEDEAAAERAAQRCSGDGDPPVSLQEPAPRDERDVDAYLVANPQRRVRSPTGSLEAGLTFETSARQYGALGEALLTSHQRDPPVLVAYLRRTSDRDRTPSVELDPDPEPVTYRHRETGERVRWEPDCAATVEPSDGAGGEPADEVVDEDGCADERRLLVEVKAGAASTLRDQRRVMQWAATDAEVLLVRVDLSGLPDEYETRIERIDPIHPGEEWLRGGGSDRSLGEFG